MCLLIADGLFRALVNTFEAGKAETFSNRIHVGLSNCPAGADFLANPAISAALPVYSQPFFGFCPRQTKNCTVGAEIAVPEDFREKDG